MKSIHVLSKVLLAVTLLSCHKEPKDSLLPQKDTDPTADILISEVLFNPKKGGAEFIELYNCSDKVIDLAQYSISSTNAKGATGNSRAISPLPLYIYPGTYKLLSKTPAAVVGHYHTPEYIDSISVQNFPQLTNSQGAVLLLRGEEIIDSLHYTEKMHDPLIRNPQGVSLERVNFRWATNSPGNFISASATSGYATPGYQNSQRVNREAKGPAVQLSKRILHIGKNETLSIQFNLPVGGKMTNITIFSATGTKVHELVRNHRLGTLDQIPWDGKGMGRRKLPAGSYYLHIELYDASGFLKHFKELCFLRS